MCDNQFYLLSSSANNNGTVEVMILEISCGAVSLIFLYSPTDLSTQVTGNFKMTGKKKYRILCNHLRQFLFKREKLGVKFPLSLEKGLLSVFKTKSETRINKITQYIMN